MRTTSIRYDLWTEPNYEIKVRGTMFLWGSAGIKVNIVFDKQLVLHFQNDLFGEAITFGTVKAGGEPETLGTLQRGEFVSIPLNNVAGVFATCEQESTVCCLIK